MFFVLFFANGRCSATLLAMGLKDTITVVNNHILL